MFIKLVQLEIEEVHNGKRESKKKHCKFKMTHRLIYFKWVNKNLHMIEEEKQSIIHYFCRI